MKFLQGDVNKNVVMNFHLGGYLFRVLLGPIIIATLFCLPFSTVARAQTFVLVHGALFTGAGWSQLENLLQRQSYKVVTVDAPGRLGDSISPAQITLRLAAEKVCAAVNLQAEPVILVGHSQGGALITQAVEFCGDKIKALVYMTAVMPLNGEQVFQDLSTADNANFEQCATYDDTNQLFRVNRSGPIHKMFMDDLDAATASQVIQTMVDEPAGIGNSTMQLSTSAFNCIPKYYIEAIEDRIISIETQRKIQAKIPFRRVFTMATSHTPFLSQPNKCAEHLITIAAQTP